MGVVAESLGNKIESTVDRHVTIQKELIKVLADQAVDIDIPFIVRHVFKIFDVSFELIPDISYVFYGFTCGKKLIDISGKFFTDASVVFHSWPLLIQSNEYYNTF